MDHDFFCTSSMGQEGTITKFLLKLDFVHWVVELIYAQWHGTQMHKTTLVISVLNWWQIPWLNHLLKFISRVANLVYVNICEGVTNQRQQAVLFKQKFGHQNFFDSIFENVCLFVKVQVHGEVP